MSTDNPIVTKFSLLPKPKARTKTRNKRKTLTRSHFPKKLKRKTCQASFLEGEESSFQCGSLQYTFFSVQTF